MVRLRNESAMGFYLFTWVDHDGNQRGVCWDRGMTGPAYIAPGGAQRFIVAPDRFGWRPPRKVADFKGFVARFVNAGNMEDGDRGHNP
jgi:hypothetical protein